MSQGGRRILWPPQPLLHSRNIFGSAFFGQSGPISVFLGFLSRTSRGEREKEKKRRRRNFFSEKKLTKRMYAEKEEHTKCVSQSTMSRPVSNHQRQTRVAPRTGAGLGARADSAAAIHVYIRSVLCEVYDHLHPRRGSGSSRLRARKVSQISMV